ncbi:MULTISPECIES: hypothetical protein [unclassified Campylobacter]|uniref:hypothetical protein n=1 Tax=unclassified Campylobacter TaxID=2593542 RepID=UPI001237F7D7|nr:MULTISPECIES: hypothetical protein [unclassified Campylobacter]KAA6226485.1 hypothetical protein FMM54_04400 [Campylobacter sp. LR185c]KAA6228620.1 hypothetical protein FMM55_00960 [Campylobacter sp. LR196d]KAA6229173.1 hypothetical protein FMM57_01245 [Campylobacter sp. LR286c]KAA6233964.1 hypothetical protein FMM58_01375 [Campylobacter sp. LR291e]KAA6234203.1 hypothetical protein FMM56_01300 [Campylobacter sp. LR264d]
MRIFLCLICLIFSACTTQRQYFNPEKIEAKLSYDEKLSSTITDWNNFSAKLKNNSVIAKNYADSLNFKLKKGYNLLAYEDGEFIVANNDGILKIYDSIGEELYTENFEASVVSVSTSGDDIALVLANNSIVLANRSLGVKFSYALTATSGQDSRIAAPIFLDENIIYPSLDGKLIIISRQDYAIIKNIVVSADYFFNNVIFLDIIQDKIIATTAKKIIAITNYEQILYQDADIKTLAIGENEIFIFCKDGNIIKTDFNLKKMAEKKFDFAIFTKANIYNDALYMVEKTGYLIKSDLNLNDFQVFKLEGIEEEMSFMDGDKLYYSNKILNLL